MPAHAGVPDDSAFLLSGTTGTGAAIREALETHPDRYLSRRPELRLVTVLLKFAALAQRLLRCDPLAHFAVWV
jgi:hypothetical protein